MTGYRGLHERFVTAVERRGDHAAFVESSGRQITYSQLAADSRKVAEALRGLRVGPGDCVGIFMQKSIDAIALIFGTLEVGAIYVPVDPSAKPARGGLIFADCRAKVVFSETSFTAELTAICKTSGHEPRFVSVDLYPERSGLDGALKGLRMELGVPAPVTLRDPAYILYTSGSTGVPKGVVLSHEAGDSFIDWCVGELPLHETDRFSMHAPFHFDLSVFDIHATVRVGGTGVVIPDAVGKNPKELVNLIAKHRITVWYSTPSVLHLMVTLGGLDRIGGSSVKLILFAGEEFPIEQLKKLVDRVPEAIYYNLYGPTETNVCTYFKVPIPIPHDQVKPFPIGWACSNVKVRLDEGGTEGELLVTGSGVMSGYWNRAEANEKAFWSDGHSKWYRTGDIVRQVEPGCFVYLGRRDRMLKKRGFRIEPGEIEACLHRHPTIERAAALASKNSAGEVVVTAFAVKRQGLEVTIIGLKEFCAKNLPSYMVPDRFIFIPEMPLTSTAKTDFEKLKERL